MHDRASGDKRLVVHQQRDVDELLVDVVAVPDAAMLPELIAMIGGDDDLGAFTGHLRAKPDQRLLRKADYWHKHPVHNGQYYPGQAAFPNGKT